MFKIGGSTGTGITSGLDKPRTNYQFGGGADLFTLTNFTKQSYSFVSSPILTVWLSRYDLK